MAGRTVFLAARAARVDEPEEGLPAVAALRAHLDSLEARLVETALAAGYSWSAIAGLLGVSRQAVHKKYAARLRSKEESKPGAQRPGMTDEARQAVVFARQEAASMNHRSIGPEHLLLGLLREDRGLAVEALEALGVSFAAARREVRRLYGEIDPAAEGGGQAAREAPVSNRARASLEEALREAARAGAEQLGVEHILRALARDPHGGATRALAALGVTSGDVEHELDARAGRVVESEPKTASLEERAMADDKQQEELTDQELDAETGAALPDREVMSILPLPDPHGVVPLPPLDSEHEPHEAGEESGTS